MFQEAVKQNREAIYGILAHTTNNEQKTVSSASGFMISPGIVATVAHVLFRKDNELHEICEVIRAPDIGMNMETASPIMIDAHRDFALLKLENARSSKSMQLSREIIPTGNSCGSLGFPLSSVNVQDDNLNINLTERFQGGYVSAYIEEYTEGELFSWYETDSLMYSGSSGCPVFTVNGIVFGMQAATLIGDEDSEDESRRLSISRLVPSLDMIKITRSIGIQV